MKKISLVVILAALLAAFFYFNLGRYISLESLKAHHQALVALKTNHPIAMVAGFMAIYIIQTALSLPGATILSLAAGAIFGTLLGTVYAVTAAAIGACLAFLATRYLLRDVVLKRFGPRLEGINRELEQRGTSYLLFLRLVPLFPFFLINLAAGLTRLPLSTFACATFFGIIPGGFVYVNAGASLTQVSSLRDIASPRVLAAFALLGLLALLPALYSRWKARR